MSLLHEATNYYLSEDVETVQIYVTDRYGPTQDQVEFTSLVNDKGDAGSYQVGCIDKDGSLMLKYIRVRQPQQALIDGIASGKYKPIPTDDVIAWFKNNPDRYQKDISIEDFMRSRQ